MIKIKQTIVVEGKYDKIKLSSIFDATIIQTDGFAIFKDKEKMAMLRVLAKKNGLLVLTDSDSAGFKIRSYITSCIGKENVYHAYIPDIFGKEKRKNAPSKEGKLGVEGVTKELIINALEKINISYNDCKDNKKELITKVTLFEDGFSGKANSTLLKTKFLSFLDLPERMTTNCLLDVLNSMYDIDEYSLKVAEFKKSLDS